MLALLAQYGDMDWEAATDKQRSTAVGQLAQVIVPTKVNIWIRHFLAGYATADADSAAQ